MKKPAGSGWEEAMPGSPTTSTTTDSRPFTPSVSGRTNTHSDSVLDPEEGERGLNLGTAMESLALDPGIGTFSHDALDPRSDTIRLLQVEAPSEVVPPLRCTLREVAFRERPRYIALSYTWGHDDDDGGDDGDDGPTREILVNGKRLAVHRNLWDALWFIRRSGETRNLPIWVDAVSINQGDLCEKSRQVRNMAHIFSRASSVLVWLGSGYLVAPGAGKLPVQDVTSLSRELLFGPSFDDERREIAEYAPSDRYWNRAWVVQEIAKAWKLRVGLGSVLLEWDDFVDLLKKSPNVRADSGPLRLDAFLKDKYTSTNTLRSLIKTYGGSECENARDKIYAFVGLTTDAADFPINYESSLQEVWREAVVYFWRKGDVKPAEMTELAGFLDRLLGATADSTIGRAFQDHKSRAKPPTRSDAPPVQIPVKAYHVGTIVKSGQSPTTLLGDLAEARKWELTISETFPSSRVGPAARANDELMRAMQELGELDFKLMTFAESRWTGYEAQNQKFFTRVAAGDQALGNLEPAYPAPGVLCLLGKADPKKASDSPYFIGVVPEGVPSGSALFWVPDLDKAVVVSNGPDKFVFRLLGTAMLGQQIVDKGWQPPLSKSSPKELEMNVVMNEDQLLLLSYGSAWPAE